MAREMVFIADNVAATVRLVIEHPLPEQSFRTMCCVPITRLTVATPCLCRQRLPNRFSA
jgi:hypothetical protein